MIKLGPRETLLRAQREARWRELHEPVNKPVVVKQPDVKQDDVKRVDVKQPNVKQADDVKHDRAEYMRSYMRDYMRQKRERQKLTAQSSAAC